MGIADTSTVETKTAGIAGIAEEVHGGIGWAAATGRAAGMTAKDSETEAGSLRDGSRGMNDSETRIGAEESRQVSGHHLQACCRAWDPAWSSRDPEQWARLSSRAGPFFVAGSFQGSGDESLAAW